MIKYILCVSIIFSTGIAFAQDATKPTFSDTVLPGVVFSDARDFQNIYRGIYNQESIKVKEIDIASNVAQRLIPSSRFSFDVGEQKNILLGEKILIGNILTVDEIARLCNLGVLNENANDERSIGFSYSELFSTNDQLQISGIIKNFCEEEARNLKRERELWLDLSKEGLFNNSRTDDAPFDLLTSAADIDTMFHGIIYTGNGITGSSESVEFDSEAPNISWAYSDRAFDANSGIPFFFDDLADPNSAPIPSDNESIFFPPSIPAGFLAQQNSFEPHQDTREMTQYICPPLSPECNQNITPYYETENDPITQDISWMGVLGKIKEQVSIMNDASLYGGMSTSSFGEIALPEMLTSNQFISHDPSHMIYEYLPSKSKDEQSNKTIKASLEDVLQPYDVIIAQKIRETPCGQYEQVSKVKISALEDISVCRQRRELNLRTVLFELREQYKQRTLQQAIAQKISSIEQISTELESFRDEVHFLESILERLNNKKRTS